ncbi:Nuclear cap-binding protein subunit 1 [Coemansia sp. RSA 1722]|nr:Nuclear cap-binding protein subunit 1 [Coemansia sp. RSA 1721]KAJ2606750.1 Nuclear cap-binding protein subunit 1 [Coemansia sp. RSA 1722]KAJ2639874.1 Nuclear cap-binding protein subunit 1 [Coemansia sp. RSA 1286]
MDFAGRLGGRRGASRGNVDEFGRERRDRPHGRKPYERPARGGRGGARGGSMGLGSRVGGHVDEAKDIESRLSSLIIKVGDTNSAALQNYLDALSVVLEKDYTKHEVTVLKTFRQCVLELPWKVSVYATLAGLLNAKNSETGEKIVSMMHMVLGRALNSGDWGSAKVVLRFFALLVSTRTITPESIVGVLDVLLAPVGDGDCAATAGSRCFVFLAMSTLLWAGRSLSELAPEALEQRLGVVRRFVERSSDDTQSSALTTVFHDAPARGTDALVYLLDVLRAVAEGGWKIDVVCTPQDMFADEFAQATVHSLPPLELAEQPNRRAFSSGVEFLQLVPSPSECAVRRYIVQDFICDTITQLEGNRKDCARYLLQMHTMCNEDVCSVMTTAQSIEDIDPETSLVFEYMVGEVLFTQLLQLPSSPQRMMYYASLAIELRKAEPQILATVLETLVDNVVSRVPSVDVECITRLSSWLAIYISNFGFQWDWTRWESAASEAATAPRRVFVHETLLKLLRLSYLDRLRTTLPDACLPLLPEKPPAHNFKFTVAAMDERTREVSVAMGRCLKNRGTSDQALEILQEHYAQWSDIDDGTRQTLAREMLVEHVLLLGSKTLSHMLNAIEKFTPALQRFADSAEAKLAIARTVEDFWLRHPQFFVMTIDKLIDYRIIDPITVVEMLFDEEHVGQWCKFHLWEILRNTINKVNLRVAQLQTRMAEDPGSEGIEATLAQMTQEQNDSVVATARHFVRLLSSQSGSTDDVDRAWLMGRFKEFMRTYRAQIMANIPALESLVFNEAANEDTRQVFVGTRNLPA